MTPFEVRARLRKQPFQPFRIVTTGMSYDIHHPEMVIVGVGMVGIGLPSSNDPTLAEGIHEVSLYHVVRLEPLGQAQAAG